MTAIQLAGRIFLNFEIETLSGLHIGGSDEGIAIGGVDKTVIRNAITNQPYIPGSSLRGKVRSLLEKYTGASQNNSIGRDVSIHSCKEKEEYLDCPVCQIFGVPGERKFSTPTRLIVRDVAMSRASVAELEKIRTDLPFTESKTEVAIDRVTSAASPRQMERVPAGVIFGPAELVYSLYDGRDCNSEADLDRFHQLLTGLQLLEDDYLGGLGSRGSGKIALRNIRVQVKAKESYTAPTWAHAEEDYPEGYPGLDDLLADYEELKSRLQTALGKG